MQNYCPHCDNDPCLWYIHGNQTIESVGTWIIMYRTEYDGNNPTNNLIRKFCYRTFTFLHHGPLGSGYRIEIPKCVIDAIRNEYSDDHYMGFKSS